MADKIHSDLYSDVDPIESAKYWLGKNTFWLGAKLVDADGDSFLSVYSVSDDEFSLVLSGNATLLNLPAVSISQLTILSAEDFLYLTESDQVDPAGRWRYRAEADILYLEHALTASWATDFDWLTLNNTLGTVTIGKDLNSLTFVNQQQLNWKDVGGTARSVLYLHSNNSVYLDNDATGDLILRTNNASGSGTWVERIKIGHGAVAGSGLINIYDPVTFSKSITFTGGINGTGASGVALIDLNGHSGRPAFDMGDTGAATIRRAVATRNAVSDVLTIENDSYDLGVGQDGMGTGFVMKVWTSGSAVAEVFAIDAVITTQPSTFEARFNIGNTTVAVLGPAIYRPNGDATIDLGATSYRWNNSYLYTVYTSVINSVATNGTIAANNADGNTIILKARDTDVGLVEVARMAGAADPYFGMGATQQFKFYNSGYADFNGTVNIADLVAGSDAKSLSGYNNDNAYFVFKARDNAVGLAEVARLGGAADPYFGMGGSQQHKFTNAGLMGLFSATPVAQQALIADPAGGGTQDAEARTAINAILDLLIAYGLMAAA